MLSNELIYLLQILTCVITGGNVTLWFIQWNVLVIRFRCHGKLFKQIFQVLPTAQSKSFEQINKVQECQLSGMCDGTHFVISCTYTKRDSPSLHPVAISETESRTPWPES